CPDYHRRPRPSCSAQRFPTCRPGYPTVMTRHIEARFEIASWDETPFEGGDEAPKLTEALVSKRYEGDIKGTSTTKWLMAYSPDKTALFVGVEHIAGTIGGKKGSPGLLHDGQPRAAPRRPVPRGRRGGRAACRIRHRGVGEGGGHRKVPRRSRRLDDARPRGRVVALVRREPAGGHRTPPPRGHAYQALALVHHRLPVLRPVGMFTCDGPVVVDQRLDCRRQVDPLGVTVDLDVGVVEFLGEHRDAGPWCATDVGRFGPPWIAGDHDAAGAVDPTRNRGALQRAVRAKRNEHHAMSRPNEAQ